MGLFTATVLSLVDFKVAPDTDICDTRHLERSYSGERWTTKSRQNPFHKRALKQHIATEITSDIS